MAATSANVHGAPDPARIDEVPAEIRDAVAAILDTGTLPGTPSVIDPAGPGLRRFCEEGAVAADGRARIARVAAE